MGLVTRIVGMLCALVLLALVAIGVLEGLVWTPLTLVPGEALATIYGAMHDVGEGTTIAPAMWGWGVLAVLSCLIPLIAVWRLSRGERRRDPGSRAVTVPVGDGVPPVTPAAPVSARLTAALVRSPVGAIVQVAAFVGAAIVATQLWATFGIGMSVADTYLTAGGHSVPYPFYALAGVAMLVLGITLAVVRRGPRGVVERGEHKKAANPTASE